jgi:glycosyltransferase involved in cell wall biosynthesis
MKPSSGGPCQGIRNSIPHLQIMGISNDVVCLDNEEDDYGVEDHFKIVKLGKGVTSYQFSSQLTKWLEKNIVNYDAVIVHGIWQFPNYAVYKVIRSLNKQINNFPKVIVMPHGMLDPYFQKDASRKWKAKRNEIVWELTEKRAINAADAMFFTCEEELLLARTTFQGYHPRKEINVGYGIRNPPEKTEQHQQAFQEIIPTLNSNYWLYLSRIHPKKGVDLLIKSYMALCSGNVDVPDLVIAGPVDSEYAKEMMDLAQNNSKIHFTGMLKGDAKWGAMYGCEAYLLPSHQENFGIAIVEAMACRKPVLVTQQVNIWREIKASDSGWILETSTAENIEKMLKIILETNPFELIQKGQNAYKNFEEKFTVAERATIFAETIKLL